MQRAQQPITPAGKVVRMAAILAVTWTVIIAGSFCWYYRANQREVLEMARSKAIMAFDRDRLYRHWVSRQGGVYVPVSDQTPPNPQLSHVPERDIVTPSGRRLTLVNAAYMARQVFDAASPQQSSAGRGRFTSLTPLRPENRPDPWETMALRRFEQGVKEVSGVQLVNGRSYMRLMRVSLTEKPCLNCHARQGAREGEIRGGVGVVVPITDILEANRPQLLGAASAHGVIWLLGLGLIGTGSRRLCRSVVTLERSEEEFKLQTRQLEEEVEERRRSEEARLESERFLAAVIDTEPECLKLLARDGSLLMMNPAGLEMIQADSFEQVKGACVYPLIAPEYREEFVSRVEEVFQGKGSSFDFEILGLKGRRLWMETRCVPFRNEQGEIVSLLGITRDITDRKRYEEELRDLTLVDELTGLTNRRGFILLARQQMKMASRNRMRMALVFADLDRLKEINDTFGHGAGDQAIIDTAVILKNSFRASDIVARVGGDEFVALSIESSLDVEGVIRERLAENIHAHNLDAGRPCELSISFGIAVYDPENPVVLDALLELGDRLMYQEKRAKRERKG